MPRRQPARRAKTPRARRRRWPRKWKKTASAIAGQVIFMGLVGGVVLYENGVRCGPSYTWDPEVQPVLAKTTGSEVVVGGLEDSGRYFGAFDAETGDERWKIGPFDTCQQGETGLAVSGSHVVVIDCRAKAHIYDLATGKEQHTVALTDKIRIPDDVWSLGDDRAAVKQVDERTTVLDLSTGSAREAPGDWTPPSYLGSGREDPNKPHDLPEIPGFEPERMFKSDGMIVVSGKKSPGTPIPMVVGLEPGASAPKWMHPMPTVDLATVRTDTIMRNHVGVQGDRFIGIYGVGEKAWHMTAIDVRTGARQWDVTLDEVFAVDDINGFLLWNDRVFVVRMESLELYDAATGKLVETIGRNEQGP